MERDDDRYKISSWTATQVGGEARLQTQGNIHSDESVGRAMIEAVMRAMAENVCKQGHRYHVLKPREPQLYCRRCGTVINADG